MSNYHVYGMSSYYLSGEWGAAKAAELRAAVLAEADAGVLACEAELALRAAVAHGAELALTAARKRSMELDGKYITGSEQSVLEESVRQARANERVAAARVNLLRWELKALQLRASAHVEDTAAVPEMPTALVETTAVAAEVPRPERDW